MDILKSSYGCCDNCMCTDDIKICGVVTLCKKCRIELKDMLIGELL